MTTPPYPPSAAPACNENSGRVLSLEELRACMAADREAAERGEPGLGPNGLFCRRCGGDIVEVDNPLRREFRHRRGQECRP